MMNTKGSPKKRGSTMLLRGVIILIGLLVAALCIFVLPPMMSEEVTRENAELYNPILLGMYVAAVPFFVALYQALKLLGYIDRNKAFLTAAVNALKNIKYCALTISALFAAGMPYIFYVADRDDAPGVAALGFVIIGASFVIATAAAVFQRLFQNAVDIKSENDLTV